MKSSKLKYTLKRMSGMQEKTRKLLASPSFLNSSVTGDSANSRNLANQPVSSLFNNNHHEINFSDFSPFGPSKRVKNDVDKQLVGISSDRFVDDYLLGPDELIEEVDIRIANMKRRYRPRFSGIPPQRILVIGAGPVGLRCAIGAALAGNHVTVIEQYGGETRARYVGVFSPEQQYLAAIGAPKSMFAEVPTRGTQKRAVTLSDLQVFLKAIALKADVEIWLHTQAQADRGSLQEGVLKCAYSASDADQENGFASQMVRLDKNRSKGMGQKHAIEFDLLVDATGGRSKLKRILLEKQVVGFRTICKDELASGGTDATIYHSGGAPAGASFLYDQANYDNYWRQFVDKSLNGHDDVADNIDCFVSNIDRSILSDDKPFSFSEHCPPDWIWKLCCHPATNDSKTHGPGQNVPSVTNGEAFRIQLEGPFPQHFNGSRTMDLLRKKNRNPIDVVMAFLRTSGADRHIDQQAWNRYCSKENGSSKPAQNTASLFNCQLTGIHTSPDRVSLWGLIPGTTDKRYFIAGDAALSAWYRFGAGIMDGFYSASIFDQLLHMDKAASVPLVMRWERYLRQRAVQVLYSIYLHEELLDESNFMRRMLVQLCSA